MVGECGTAGCEDHTGCRLEEVASAWAEGAMRTTVNGRFLAVAGELFGDQPAETANRQPGGVQSVDLQGKVPQVRAGISSACVGMPEHGQTDTRVIFDRSGSLSRSIAHRGCTLALSAH